MKNIEYIWNFPETRFEVGKNELTRRGQADQIVQEAAEIFSAAENNTEEQYIEELLDCVHACETALREFETSKINKVVDKVINKNCARSYYRNDAINRLRTIRRRALGRVKPSTDIDDIVNNPSHYTERPVETIDVIEMVIDGLEPIPAMRLAHVLRYALRAGSKDDTGIDLAKANNYAHRLTTGKWRKENE